jgi:tetratricopeptide (TPR) repeat protein
MRKSFFVFLIFMVIIVCFPIHVQAKNLTYASDFYALGNDYANMGQYEEALTAYQTARSMDERFYNEHYGISYQIGWVLNKLGRYDEALKEFQIAEKYRPEWIKPFAIYYNEGCLLAKLGRNEEALEDLDSALLYEPHNWYILYNKGIVLSKMGRSADAVSTFDESRKAFGTSMRIFGSYQETAATYDRAQGISPPATYPPSQATAVTGFPRSVATDAYDKETSVDQLIRTGYDFSARYQYEDALGVFERALKIEPSNYKAMFYKGNALANSGRYAEAEYALNQTLLWLDLKRHEGWYVDTQYTKAWVLAQQGKYDEALKTYDKLFIVNPDYFRAHHDKAWVLAQQGKYNEAVKEYNRSLEWEDQYTLEVQSYTILGPLGTYREVADAYDKTKSTQSFVSELPANPSYNVVIYQTDFSADPGWRTSAPRLYFWDPVNKSYHFRSETSPGYAEINIPYNGTSFNLEYDITIPHADPGALVRFGLSQHNISENLQNQMVRYNTENLIMGEFKSWRANSYRAIKDGDKTIQVYAIDSRKYASDPEYEGMCRINREESIVIPSFGENRVYHVVINSDPEKETISIKVTDNLHEKTYNVCSGKLSKTGIFHSMDRLILVAEPAENAYIEGSIDNIVLSVPAVPEQTVASGGKIPASVNSAANNLAVQGTMIPVTAPESISPGPFPSENGAGTIGSLPSIFTSPAALVPVILLVIVVIGLFIGADYLNKRNMK